MNRILRVAPLLLALSAAPALPAELSAPVAVPVVDRIPAAADVPWPGGTMTLEVDATDLDRALMKVVQRIPLAPGTTELTLLYPNWLPGHHAPRGAIWQVSDLHFYADGKEIAWERDAYDVFAIHLALPEGASEVTATFVNTTPLRSSEGRIVMTQEMLNLQWEQVSLYPAGYYVRQLPIQASATFPEGWEVFTALDGKVQDGARVSWAATNYEVLIDSPVFAGKHFKRWDLGHDVSIGVVADEPRLLEIKPENLDTHKRLVEQALATFGSRPFDHYTFLLALTDRMGGIGREHHRSSENQMQPETWIEWDDNGWDRDVLPHELAHSWVGKFRRPEGLWTPDYRVPMKNDLLWVYEGQDQFWGLVLAARSGIRSKEIVLGYLATAAGNYSEYPGRAWRSVEDTTRDPIMAARRTKTFSSLNRGEDYYVEGALVWLEADQIIRKGTDGKKGLDDFAKAFFGIRDGDWGQVTHDFDDVVAALNATYAYDWASFLNQRLYETNQPAPLAGIEMAGYSLVWKDELNPYDKGRYAYSKTLGLYHSIGLTLDSDGNVTSVRWDSPAFQAGVVNGVRVIAVNGEAYSADTLKEAITDAKGTDTPIELLVRRGDRFMTIPIAYHDGLRWPWLERTAPGKAPAPLDELLEPRKIN